MTTKLYLNYSSPFCRSVLFVAKHLGIDLHEVNVDLVDKQQLRPEFLKLNPRHTLPTLEDEGVVIWESRAIIQYLCNKYGRNSQLYPTDPAERAKVDMVLDFDLGTLAPALKAVRITKLVTNNSTKGAKPTEQQLTTLKDSLTVLDSMIGKNGGYSAGKHLTIADLSLIPQFLTVTTEELADYMHVRHWYSEITAKEMPYFDEINSMAVKSIEDRTRRLTERADKS